MADDATIERALASLRKGGAARVAIMPYSDTGALLRVTPKKPKPTKRLGYRECVEYIAHNDDEGMLHDGDPSVVVSMVAHLFEKDEQVVIADVLRYLENHRA
jgi:hypothetical protein